MSYFNTFTINNGAFQELLILLGKMVHGNLVKQIEYLKVENQILHSKLSKCVRCTPSERRRLLKFGLQLGPDIRRLISIVDYSTFRKWIKDKNKVHNHHLKRGRPRTLQEIRELVLKMAKENNWGYTRILGELKKLRINCLSRTTIKNILKENGLDPAPQRDEDTWNDFVKRHFQTLWACDFFPKKVFTFFGPKVFYVLFFINIYTRKVHVVGVTRHPTREWVNKKTRAISFIFTRDNRAKILIRDRDGKFSEGFDEILRKVNMQVIKLPFKSPNLNPYAESWVGTIKRECLDRFIIFGEKHLKYLVKEYVNYYNTVRPHSSLDNMPLDYKIPKTKGRIKCKSRLGGVIKHYYRQ